MKENLIKELMNETDTLILEEVYSFYKNIKTRTIPKEQPDELDIHLLNKIQNKQDKEYLDFESFEKYIDED